MLREVVCRSWYELLYIIYISNTRVTYIYIFYLPVDPPGDKPSFNNTNQVKFWFLRRGETGVPGENLSVQSGEPTNSTHIWRRIWESNPGHNGGRRVLSPLHHPCTPTFESLPKLQIPGKVVSRDGSRKSREKSRPALLALLEESLASVNQKVANAIHWINHYPADKY